jgi:protein-S-isoprenylcysteine O-methyltransferase Ste14
LVPSRALVGAQFGIAAALLVSSWPPANPALWPWALGLLAIGVALGIAALAVNRPGNFIIRPEVKARANLVTGGVYRHLRHPMYAGLLLGALALVLLDPRPWRWLAWLALVAVLVAKSLREERYLQAAFEQYAAYRARTWRFLPWVW